MATASWYTATAAAPDGGCSAPRVAPDPWRARLIDGMRAAGIGADVPHDLGLPT